MSGHDYRDEKGETMKIRWICLIVALALCGVRSARAAQSPQEGSGHEAVVNEKRTVPTGASKAIKSCHLDIDRWCKNVKPGQGRIGACLKAHAKELSKRCRRWAAHGGEAHIEESLIKDVDGLPAANP
jgi:hypothetical protein